MTPSLELRLRARIDTLTDERDALRMRLNRVTCSRTWTRKSRDMWRERAKAAEEMLSKTHRQKRRKVA